MRKGKLVVVNGPDQGKELEISKPRVTGGRSIISDLVVQDKAVSGTHFEVSARDDGYRLRDLNSRNGIFVVRGAQGDDPVSGGLGDCTSV